MIPSAALANQIVRRSTPVIVRPVRYLNSADQPQPAPGNPEEQVTLSRGDYDWMVHKLMGLGELPSKDAPLFSPGHPPPPTVPLQPDGDSNEYRLHVRGTYSKDGERVAIVSSGTRVWPVTLKLVQFLTLLILASFARRNVNLDAPIDVRGGKFLQPRRVGEVIDHLKATQKDLIGQAENLTRQDLYVAWYSMGERFDSQGLAHLLQARRGSGYRIHLLAHLIKITLFDEKGSRTWG